MIDLNHLPKEAKSLKEIIITLNNRNNLLLHKNTELSSKNTELTERSNKLLTENTKLLTELANLKSQLALLRKKEYGQSSEKIKKQVIDLEDRIEEKEISLGLRSGKIKTPEEEKAKKGRQKLSEKLPREDKIIPAPKTCPDCGGNEFRQISEDISEILEYVPSSFKVVRHVRARCACKCCETIVQAEPESKTIDKGKAGSGLLSHILIQKYCNHLPLYRQSEIYKMEEVELSRSTMANWVGVCANLLDPIAKLIQEYILSKSQIHGDDTPVKVLAPELGKTKTGRIWAYVFDGSRHQDITPKAVSYFYSPDRKGIWPQSHLKNFTGVLHADSYAGFNELYKQHNNKPTNIRESSCWAHTRRKFYDIAITSDNATISNEVIEQIGKLYDIEREIKGLDPGSRLSIRQERSKKLVDDLFAAFKRVKPKLPVKGLTAKAINYALNNEESLKVFLEDGKVEIDNNPAERALRIIAVGRKNWLFAGSDTGGETSAIIYTLIQTCKMNNISVWKYLKYVLSVIQDYNIQKIHELLPWNVKLN